MTSEARRLSIDAQTAQALADAAKTRVRKAKAELKKARKASKAAKKAAKRARKKLDSAPTRNLQTPPVKGGAGLRPTRARVAAPHVTGVHASPPSVTDRDDSPAARISIPQANGAGDLASENEAPGGGAAIPSIG